MRHKIRVRQSAENTSNGKPGNWMVWAAFASPIEAFEYAKTIRVAHPTWDVETYEGRGAFEFAEETVQQT